MKKYFPGFLSFAYSTEQLIPRPVDKKEKEGVPFREEEKDTAKTQIMVNKLGFNIHKTILKKG